MRRARAGIEMTEETVLSCDGPPSAAAYMLGAMLRGARRRAGGPVTFPALRLRWTGFRADRAAIERLTGVRDAVPLALLAPHVTGFRALMALLTHPAMPLPIWRALQVRNELVLHRREPLRDAVLEARVARQRTLAKGLELDLRTAVRDGGGVAWEGQTTFYYRGTFLASGDAPDEPERPPSCAGAVVATWRAPSGVGWRMGRLTGDYNPLHYSSGYARRRGFSAAFLHPPLALGQCLARLPPPAHVPVRLETWVRGQVYAGAEVRLCADDGDGVSLFALEAGREARPALVGRISTGA